MKRMCVGIAMLLSVFSTSYGETYKCKTVGGKTEISDQPCRDSSKTVTVVEKEYISESQRKSSAEWIQRGAVRLERQAQAEAAAQLEAQRLEAARQAAYQEQQRKHQEAQRQEQLIREVQQLRREQAEAAEAANRAAAAANNAAAAASSGGTRPCRIVGSYCY